MRGRSRRRRVLKWVGTTVCVLIAGVFILSGRFHVYRWFGGRLFAISSGTISTAYYYSSYYEGSGQTWQFQWSYSYRWPRPWSVYLDSSWSVVLPLWLPFLAVAAPTAFLWWRDRRWPPGHCTTCGYDLTGNVSGRCPECGVTVTKPRLVVAMRQRPLSIRKHVLWGAILGTVAGVLDAWLFSIYPRHFWGGLTLRFLEIGVFGCVVGPVVGLALALARRAQRRRE